VSKILSLLSGSLIKDVGNVLDNLTTSKEEIGKVKNEIQRLLLDAEAKMQQEVTSRWKADMTSDSWLSKNVRPLTLIFLVVTTMLLVIIDAGFINFEVKDNWVGLLELVLITVIGAYFGGRTFEKNKSTKA
jgi:hypothetical protein|tara:strand:- start:48 stop:440 length:393 start_codon:yes stop_codon:yes gene_type:complete